VGSGGHLAAEFENQEPEHPQLCLGGELAPLNGDHGFIKQLPLNRPG
jgi:hypothetical protein